ncbi:hypothetical protein CF168_10560 [Shewanella bicestrii]|uniref:DUF2489 domain-containing protein n=1 Tax=Shewanella bicestrii TaxID=2018305 RepID=A0A220UMZ2_9GAMM|nr:hypothetical protein [Shewanella bicestrii]ASK69276.1 hypothetical protein CF168_10560 [Shewanella bicestrii]
MALPWLIGAAVVALGAAAVSAFSDDSDSGSGGNDDEERRRRERAEQERKARAHKEKLESMKEAFVHEGMQKADDLQQSLDGQIKVLMLGDKPFKATIDDDPEYQNLVSPTYVEVYDLQFLPQETQDYLVKLESLYDVELEPEEELMKVPVRLKEIDHKLAQLKALREKL